jgi:hypothetical protein
MEETYVKRTRPDEGRVSGIELDSRETGLSPSVGSGISHGLRKRKSTERMEAWRREHTKGMKNLERGVWKEETGKGRNERREREW